jgi:hypothetical protein
MRRLAWIAVLLVVLGAPAAPAGPAPAEPHPSLSPEDVVRIQIEALRRNDVPYKNHGIEQTFAFASPANRRATGPLEHFTRMVHGPVYAPMIGHRGAQFRNFGIDGDGARIDVIVQSADGRYLGYRFILSRQRGNAYEGSWMTDAVFRIGVTSARAPAATQGARPVPSARRHAFHRRRPADRC